MKPLNELTLSRQLELLSARQISSKELVSAYLDQIDRLDAEIGAWITVDRQGALEQASRIDDRRMRGDSLGRWRGFPADLRIICAPWICRRPAPRKCWCSIHRLMTRR